ncbi:hypothetical protein [Deinococcus enclensis]|uniref:Uncharacterized protein n=1 Tax=Deinococcus enclensis TaxID=1049582 RepID=A0ABT9MHR8_9DEIO|nr:hypothetical protein [Deinococcus enclensis]MDP9766141.1 hypothetical protein [Deinococcus enclensis]
MFVTSSMPAGPVMIPVYKRVAELTHLDLQDLFAEPVRPHVQVLELDETAGALHFDPAGISESARQLIHQEARGPMIGLLAVPAYVVIRTLSRELDAGTAWAVADQRIVTLTSLVDAISKDQYAAPVGVAVHSPRL